MPFETVPLLQIVSLAIFSKIFLADFPFNDENYPFSLKITFNVISKNVITSQITVGEMGLVYILQKVKIWNIVKMRFTWRIPVAMATSKSKSPISYDTIR